MSSKENLLKNLLANLLDIRLKRLEKRNTIEVKDLNFAKLHYKKQNIILNKFSKKVSEIINNNKNVSFNDSLYNKSEMIKHKGSQNFSKLKLSPKYYQNNNKIRNAVTPTRKISKYALTAENWTKKRNYKYNYVKSRYMDETNKISESNMKKNREGRKLFLTPEPRIKKFGIKKKKKSSRLGDKVNIEQNKIYLNRLDIRTKRNINTMKREKNYKKNTIVSDIDLGSEEITFVLDELKKDEEKKQYNSDEESESEDNCPKMRDKSSSSNSNNSINETKYTVNNKKIILEFGKYINTLEGNNIVILIASFSDIKTKFNFFSCSKQLIKNLSIELDNIDKYVLNINKITSINSIDDEIKNINDKYKGEDFDSPKYSFKSSLGSIKALEILDDEIYNNIFKKEELNPPLNNIILIYRIYFQLINKEEFTEIENDKKFWQEIRNYFLENDNNKLGSFINRYISEFDFTKENIYKLKKLSSGKEDKLKPTNYESLCKTTGLIVFIIRDSLEYCGIIPNNNKMNPRVVMDYFELLKDNLNKLKEYLDFLNTFK